MRGKVTADAYSGEGELGWKARACGFAMHDDDWEVTRHHLPASLQPIRAEQIGYWRFFVVLNMESHHRALRNRPWGR